jgi:hypothetical protein
MFRKTQVYNVKSVTFLQSTPSFQKILKFTLKLPTHNHQLIFP